MKLTCEMTDSLLARGVGSDPFSVSGIGRAVLAVSALLFRNGGRVVQSWASSTAAVASTTPKPYSGL